MTVSFSTSQRFDSNGSLPVEIARDVCNSRWQRVRVVALIVSHGRKGTDAIRHSRSAGGEDPFLKGRRRGGRLTGLQEFGEGLVNADN